MSDAPTFALARNRPVAAKPPCFGQAWFASAGRVEECRSCDRWIVADPIAVSVSGDQPGLAQY